MTDKRSMTSMHSKLADTQAMYLMNCKSTFFFAGVLFSLISLVGAERPKLIAG